jgi:hypothetical protein
MTTSTSSKKQWHIDNWTGLGWLETGIKLLAHLVAFVALARALQSGTPATLEGVRLFQLIVMGMMALGITAAVADRYLEKEIIAMVFVLVNVAAHWGMVFALLRTPALGILLTAFAGLMLLGDLVKIAFLARTKFTVRGYNPRSLVYLTSGVVALEVVLLLLSFATSA